MNRSNIDEITKKEASKWHNYIQQKNLEGSIELCDLLISDLKVILNERTWEDAKPEDYNKVLMYVIAFKAFKDFSELGRITSKKNWEQKKKNIENAWQKHWDCRERLEFVDGNIESPMIDWIFDNLNRLLANYQRVFGNGLYASPEILLKKQICSICKKDIRACEHIKGYGYNGEICRAIAKDFEIKGISLVTVPKDPRCRVWPWRMTAERTFETTVMTLSQMDDFIKE